MNYYFYNTDAGSLVGPSRFHKLIEQGFAATGGPRRFGEQLRRLAEGDILPMYENGIGIVAIGEVTGRWDGKSHNDLSYYENGDICKNVEGRECEYRIKVDWLRNLSDNPISIQELRRRLGYTPRGAVRPIWKWRAEVERMVSEICGDAVLNSRPKQARCPQNSNGNG